MNNLDKFKLDCPEDEPENRCSYCDDICHGDFCNKEHKTAYFND